MRAVLLLFVSISLRAETTADPIVRGGPVVWFELNETMKDVEKRLGPPRFRASFAKGFESWQYYLNPEDGHEPSHYFVFRQQDQRLISVTRHFEPARNVEDLVPAGASVFVPMPSNAGFGIRVRRLSNGRVLLAVGAAKPGQPVTQMVLTTVEEAGRQYGWLGPALR